MKRRALLSGLLVTVAAGEAWSAQPTTPNLATLRQQVTDTELAFAKTMAERDFEAFMTFVSEEAVFLNGGKPLRGKAAVAERWKPFFNAAKAPFAWKPDLVEVLESGTLAESIGPVFGPDGELVSRFYSTWRQEAPGVWRIVFDNGYNVCNCPKP